MLLNVIATFGKRLPFLMQIAPVLWGSLTALGPLALAADPAAILPHTPAGWALVIGIGLAAMLLPAALTTFALTRAGAGPVGVVSALELPVAFFAAWLLLGQQIGPATLAGGGLLVVAALLAAYTRKPRPPAAVR